MKNSTSMIVDELKCNYTINKLEISKIIINIKSELKIVL